ncbi:MAG: hypothetical protein P1V97_11480 [Planctomycetota bacterium]|nr:hypothetical protein [Planctomycetota bacterium]
MREIINQLRETLHDQDYKDKESPNALLLFTFRNWNMNRGVAWVELDDVPENMGVRLNVIRKAVAKEIGYTPVFYPLGLQLIVSGKGLSLAGLDPQDYVAKINNQTAMIQSLFLIDTESYSFAAGRSWGQTVTSKLQDAIEETLLRELGKRSDASSKSQLCTRCGDRMNSARWVCEACVNKVDAAQDEVRNSPKKRILTLLIVLTIVVLFALIVLRASSI